MLWRHEKTAHEKTARDNAPLGLSKS
jgi:hypothetical protein